MRFLRVYQCPKPGWGGASHASLAGNSSRCHRGLFCPCHRLASPVCGDVCAGADGRRLLFLDATQHQGAALLAWLAQWGVQVGEVLEERLVLENHHWFPKLWVQVADNSTLPGHH